MPIWGTSRSLPARFEVGEGSGDLPASLEVGQGSRDLSTRLMIRDAASTDLYVKFVATRSRDLLGRVDIRRSATLDLPSRTEIQSIGSADLLGTADIGHSVDLHCEFEVGQGAVEVLARVEVRQSGSAELLGKFEAQATAELLGKADIRGLSSAEFLGRFEVGQGAAELLARVEVGQGSINLLGRCDVRQLSSAGLLTRLSIPTSVDLLARFRPAQEVMNLSGRLVVRHPAFPIGLGGSFSVGMTNTYLDLRSALTVMRLAYPELVSGFVVRGAGISVELLGKAVIRHSDSVELPSKTEIQHAGVPVELACNFVTQSFDDLAAKMMVLPGIPGYITWYDPASWVNVVVGAGRGFIAMPWVEVDVDVKVTENSSARLTSAQSGRGYKEIRFGWDGTCAGGLDLRREVPADDGLDLVAVCIIRHRGVEDDLSGGLEVAHRSSESLPAGFEIQDFERLFARFYMFFRRGEDLRAKFRPGQEILDLPARFTIRQSGTANLRAGITDFVRHIDLACNLVVRHSAPPPFVEYPLGYVFTEGTGSPYDVMYDTIEGVGPVSIAQSETSSATGYNNQRKLVETSGGILYAVYHRQLSGQYQVYVKESADYGLTWTNETRISTYAGMGTRGNLYPSIAVDSQDRLHVVWLGRATGYTTYYQIWYTLYDGSWTDPVRISTYAGMSSGYQYYPCISVDSNDDLHVVWYGRATGYTTYYQIWYAAYAGSWSDPVRISTYAGMSGNYQYRPCIAIDSNDDLHVVWYGRATGYSYYQIWHALYDGSWGSPVRISTYPGMSSGYQYYPCITVDSGDRLHVIWNGRATGYTTYYQIWYALYDGSWTDPVRISTYAGMESNYQYYPSINVDRYLHVLWQGRATGFTDYYKVWYAKYTDSWIGPDCLQPTGQNMHPNLMIPPLEVIVTEIKGLFEVGQGQEDLLGKCVVRRLGAPVELLGEFVVRHVGVPVELLGRGIVRSIGFSELPSKIAWIRLRAAQLLGKFDVGRGSRELLGRFEVGQGSNDLLACVEVGQASQDLEAALFVGFSDSKDLSARFRTGTGVDWLPDWSHREKHQIIGSTVGTLTNYPVSITVHYGSGTDSDDDVYCDANCRTDFGDIRFTAYNGSTLLDYWLQEKIDSDYAIFWVEVDEIPKAPAWAIIYVYYDNPGATYTDPQQHGKDTFTAFDDFPGVALDGQWAVDANISVTVAGGKLTCKATASSWDTWHGIHMAVANVQGIRLESYGVDYGHVSSDLFEFGSILGVDWTHRNLGHMLKDSHSSTSECYLTYLYDNDGLAKGNIEGQHNLTLVAQRDQNGDVKFFKDGAEQQVGTETSNDSFDTLMILVNRYLTYASPNLEIERILARKYVDPEPTHGTWG